MTNKRPVSRYPAPSVNEIPDDIKERILSIQAKAGFVPNVFLVLAHRLKELRAFIDFHDALMERDSGLTKTDKEMIVVATSGANNCLYCVIAHGAILRIRAKNSVIADQISVNFRKADIPEKQIAMLEFAIKISDDSKSISDSDFEHLRGYGFDDEDIWDIAGITSFFGLSNRMANFTSMRPNEEFYSMGR